MRGESAEEALPLHLAVQARGTDVVITAKGELDISGTDMVADVWVRAVPTTCRRLIIDLSELTFLDASGLRAVLAAQEVCGATVEVCLLEPSPQVRRVLDVASAVGAVDLRCNGTYRGAHLITVVPMHAGAAEGD